ncbi:MAG: type III secretion system chaperone [Kiritimatiellae bacterium]|nr:type III secretion system chaperone [Kiritimatiellia bacterium]
MTTENTENFNGLVSALAETAGVESLTSEDGGVFFAIDDDMGVAITSADAEEVGVDLLVATIIVDAAPTDAEALTFLLEQNYLGVGAGDGSFAIEHETGVAVLYRAFPLPMDAETFVDAFSRLAGAARAARARLVNTRETPDLMSEFIV